MVKQFQIQTDNRFAETAFRLFINDFARYSAKGLFDAGAWEQAAKSVAALGLSGDEQAEFDNLVRAFVKSDCFVETEFIFGGETQKARVIAYRAGEYPAVI